MVERCLRRLGDEVERFGGTVDKYIGDNVMALFGAPVAHEDDAERAVRAALGMQAAMEEINADAAREYEVDFALRVGLNTGEVLAGAVGDAYTVTGTRSTSPPASRPRGGRERSRWASAPCAPPATRSNTARSASSSSRGRPSPFRRGRPWECSRRSRCAGPPRLARRASWDATTSSPSSMPPTAASSARAGPTSSRSSGRPAWASRGCPASWRALWSVTNPPPRCARDAACPTGRASCTGRSPRSCGRSAGSPTATRPTSPGRSSRARSRSCWPRRRVSPEASPPSARRRSSRACSASAPRRTMPAASRWTPRARARASSPPCVR